jgi:hypothetical protein
MYRIPFTNRILVSCSEAQATADALEDGTKALYALANEMAKSASYEQLLVMQSEAAQQLMQINLLIAGALGRIRDGADIEETATELEASLQEFDTA